MKFFIATALFSLALAAPAIIASDKVVVREVAAAAHTCPGGLTNSSPMCCSVNVLGLLALDCHNGRRFAKPKPFILVNTTNSFSVVPDGGCSGGAKANCCTLGLVSSSQCQSLLLYAYIFY